MKQRQLLWTSIFSSVMFLILVLDSKTAFISASDAISLCLYTVVPSLFPFIILSTIINRSLAGRKNQTLRPICKACGVPEGAESLLVLGFLGGYPVGAKNIYDAYQNGTITREDAYRMLAFCNNAGPAFIFGIAGSLFTSPVIPWILWAIHIFSAITVGILLPNKQNNRCKLHDKAGISLSDAMASSINTIATVCGWIIMFRILIAFMQRWFLWILPPIFQGAIIGILELANGCIALQNLPAEGARFLLCSVILAFGGVCVTMQTNSVVKKLGTGMYFPGKILQSIVAFSISYIVQFYLFPKDACINVPTGALITLLIMFLFICVFSWKKAVAIRCNLLYNSNIT